MIEHFIEVPFKTPLVYETGLPLDVWKNIYQELLECAVCWQSQYFGVIVSDSEGRKTLWIFDASRKVLPEFSVFVSAFVFINGEYVALGMYGSRTKKTSKSEKKSEKNFEKVRRN